MTQHGMVYTIGEHTAEEDRGAEQLSCECRAPDQGAGVLRDGPLQPRAHAEHPGTVGQPHHHTHAGIHAAATNVTTVTTTTATTTVERVHLHLVE